AVVAAVHARQREVGGDDGTQRPRGAEVAGMEHEAHTGLAEPLGKLGDRRQAIVCIRQHAHEHHAVLHVGWTVSRRTRSSYCSRAVITANRSPSTITSAARGREL